MTAPDPNRLMELLDQAVNAWLQPTSQPELLGSWRGNGDLLDFARRFPTADQQQNANAQPNCVVLADFVRWARSTAGTSQAINHVRTRCNGILEKEQDNEGYQLVHAITHTVLAVLDYDDQSTRQNAFAHLEKAAWFYDDAWEVSRIPVTQAPQSVFSSPGPDLSLPGAAAQFLHHAEKQGAFGSRGVTYPTYQTLWALISHLHGDDPPQPIHRNQPKALFINSKTHFGLVLPITVDKIELPCDPSLPCFLDPLSFGITELDTSLRASIWLAARCAKQSQGRQPNHSLRIACDLSGKLITLLTGSSMGGLLAAAMIATMNQQSLATQKSTTCRLWFRDRNSNIEDENTPLTDNDLVLKPIRGTVNKLSEAWQLTHGLNEFFLVGKNFDEWNTAHPDCANPKVTRVESLSELINGLMGPFAFDRELERHARAVHGVWAQAIAWKEGDPETPASKLHDHGFRYYLAPDLRIEGPLRDKRDSGSDPSELPLSEREETLVPNDVQTDSALLNLLALSICGDRWPDAPAWLDGNKKLIIYDIAGAGKSVCSHRICHVLSDRNNWKRLFGNEVPPLIIRMEGRWPREHGHEGRLLTLCEAIGRIFAEESKHNDNALIQGVVAHALRERRVCLITDGIDQMDREDRDHMVQIYNTDNEAKQCHWIGLSRVHTINEYRSDAGIFGDRHWHRVRINLFTAQQQDEYFAIPDARGRVIGQRWTQTLADRQAMGELLGLPMVLWMIRLLIDEADEQAAALGNGQPAILPVFSNLSQLYLITTRKLLARALEKNSEAVEKHLKKLNIAIPVFRADGEKIELLEHVLCLIAFQMMLMENYNGSVEGNAPVKRLLELSEYRFTKEIRDRFEKATLFEQRRIGKEDEAAEVRWAWALEVLKTIELSHRTVVEANSDAQIVYRSRKMLECLTARYLTRYATQWDIFATDDPADMPTVVPNDPNQNLSNICAWNYTTHPQWDNAWRLAIDMPQEPITTSNRDGVYQNAVIDPLVTCRSLSALFRQPKAYDARDIRPTRLMYLAWHWFEFDDSLLQRHRFLIGGKLKLGRSLTPEKRKQLGERLLLGGVSSSPAVTKARTEVLERFRDDKSRQMVKEFEERFDTILVDGARMPIPWDPDQRRAALAKWQQASSWEKSRTLIQCPPQTWIDAYDDAQSRGDNSIQDPRINPAIEGFDKQAFSPFRMAATTVTREMYHQFDPAFENSSHETMTGMPIQQSISRMASHFDAFDKDEDFPILCTNWFDGWAFCKWLGSNVGLPANARWELACRAGTQTLFHFGDELDGTLANCNGNYPEPHHLRKGPFLGRTTPVGCERYPCNPWGLFDVHGNLWEWCDNGPQNGGGRANRTTDEEVIEEKALPRYLVGGSWYYYAISSRSGLRFDFSPVYRYYDKGFRIVWSR